MPVIITGRNRPHEVVFLGFSAIIGVAFVIGAKPPTTLEQLVPTWLLWTWYTLLLASGAVGLTSLALGDPYRSLVLERAAMIGHTAAPAMYGLALLAAGTAAALFAIAFCLAWSAASAWRWGQLNKDMRTLRQIGSGP